MENKQEPGSIREIVILLLVLLNAILLKSGFIGNEKCLWFLLVTVPLLLWVVVRSRHMVRLTSSQKAGNGHFSRRERDYSPLKDISNAKAK